MDVRAKWVKELNGSLDCPLVGWSSYTKPAVFDLGCGHVACVRLDSVREKPGILSTCFYCHRTGSQPWRRAVEKLEGLGLGPMAFECHVLDPPPAQGGKPMDIHFPQAGISVEVDGSYHFSGSMHGVPAEQQYAFDRLVDATCMQQQRRLVRLHYLDEDEWVAGVLQGMQSQDFVTYTRSYGL